MVTVDITAVCQTVYRPKDTPDDEDGRPSAWIAVEGELTVLANGHSHIGNDSPDLQQLRGP